MVREWTDQARRRKGEGSLIWTLAIKVTTSKITLSGQGTMGNKLGNSPGTGSQAASRAVVGCQDLWIPPPLATKSRRYAVRAGSTCLRAQDRCPNTERSHGGEVTHASKEVLMTCSGAQSCGDAATSWRQLKVSWPRVRTPKDNETQHNDRGPWSMTVPAPWSVIPSTLSAPRPKGTSKTRCHD